MQRIVRRRRLWSGGATLVLTGVVAAGVVDATGAQAWPGHGGRTVAVATRTKTAPTSPSRPRWTRPSSAPSSATPGATSSGLPTSVTRTTLPPSTRTSTTRSVPTSATPTSATPTSTTPTSNTVQFPPAGARFDYQLGGAVGGTADAWPAGVPEPTVVARDNADAAWTGKYNICYINAFQSQPGDSGLQAYYLAAPSDGGGGSGGVVVRNGYQYDAAWGEYLLDIRGSRAPLAQHFETVMASCAAKGFRAVEFDNLDTFDRDLGGLVEADAVAYAGDLVTAAHRNGLAAVQKNAAEIAGTVPFDFVVSEECLTWKECGRYTAAFRVAFDIEYSDDTSESRFQQSCAAEVSRGSAPTFVYRDRSLSRGGVRRWCSAQSTG